MTALLMTQHLKRFALALAFVIPAMSIAHAQEATPVVAIINLQRVGQESQAALAASEKIEAYLNSVRQRYRQIQDELREEELSLNRRRSILSPDAYREEERRFLEKRDRFEREAQQVDRQLQESAFDAQRRITEHINKIVPEIAAERGINLIFNRTQVIYFAPSTQFDITDVVIERMDATLPEIPVQLPAE